LEGPETGHVGCPPGWGQCWKIRALNTDAILSRVTASEVVHSTMVLVMPTPTAFEQGTWALAVSTQRGFFLFHLDVARQPEYLHLRHPFRCFLFGPTLRPVWRGNEDGTITMWYINQPPVGMGSQQPLYFSPCQSEMNHTQSFAAHLQFLSERMDHPKAQLQHYMDTGMFQHPHLVHWQSDLTAYIQAGWLPPETANNVDVWETIDDHLLSNHGAA